MAPSRRGHSWRAAPARRRSSGLLFRLRAESTRAAIWNEWPRIVVRLVDVAAGGLDRAPNSVITPR
jgi:hypothetical protein